MQTLLGVSFGAVLWIYTIICALIGVIFLTNIQQDGFIEGVLGWRGKKHFLLKAIARIMILVIFLPSVIFFMIFALTFKILNFLEND